MKRHFENDFIEQVRTANDIVSVISEYVPLKRKGQNYWGCCPFHNEKTPSFSVNSDKGFFYCFGCKAAGNVFNFIMKYDNYTFSEALEKLANRANIPLPAMVQTPQDIARQKHRQRMWEVNELAATFFHNCLMQTKMGEKGLAYLRGRGLTEETIITFRLGFAPDSWDKLLESFKARGYTEDFLVEAGLCRRGNGKVYDYFRNRIIFPICDGKGRVVGFGGRVMDDSEPKYLNSQETNVFNKGQLLFAFDKAYKSVREKKQAILVEGYMDVISAHNRGVTNVVASLGTAFTREQGQLLLRQAEEIILAYDMDEAGKQAARRAIELTNGMDFKVRVLAMPDGKDPDDYVRNHGPAAFLKLVETAVPPFEYLVNEAMIAYDRSNLEGKMSIMNAVFPYIASIQEKVRRDDLLRSLALPLWLDNSTIFRYFREYVDKGKIRLKNADIRVQKTEGNRVEDTLVALALSSETALLRVAEYIPYEDYSDPLHVELLKKAIFLMEQEETFFLSALEKQLTEEEGQELSRLMLLCEEEYEETTFDEYIRQIRLQSLRKQYKEHSLLADKLNRAGDTRFILELKKCQEIQEEIKEWS